MSQAIKHIHVRSRRLLTAVFVTLLVVAVVSVGTFYYFNLLNRRVFKSFEMFAISANINADVSWEIVGLELKVGEMMSIVVTSPERLPQLRESIRHDFADIEEAVEDVNLPGNERIGAGVASYKKAVESLMQDYMVMNDTLHHLNNFYDSYLHKLRQLEEDIGELIVDVAMSGHESVGLQQNFLLLPLCIEEFL
ncbi:MAG: hypothetical protein PHI06_12405, partial [Desulfobulbaceae bacterium]|nr:hypothetical protein [Desulfobulbaceae bacterium]